MATAASKLLADLTRRGIELVAHGDRLRYRPRSAVTPDLAEQLRTHNAGLLAILGRAGAPGVAMEAAPKQIRWEQYIDPPPPCPGCGGLMFWWNPWGDRRCMTCDPPTTATQLLERVERIRRRLGIPSPVGAVGESDGLKRLAHS